MWVTGRKARFGPNRIVYARLRSLGRNTSVGHRFLSMIRKIPRGCVFVVFVQLLYIFHFRQYFPFHERISRHSSVLKCVLQWCTQTTTSLVWFRTTPGRGPTGQQSQLSPKCNPRLSISITFSNLLPYVYCSLISSILFSFFEYFPIFF